VSGGHAGGHPRRGHEEEPEEHENHERWLVSYADMMTLLMVLFIVMFAISQVDQKKFAALKTGLSAGFGAPIAVLPGGDQLLDPGGGVAPDSVNLAGAAQGKAAQFAIYPGRDVNPKAVTELADAQNKASVRQEVTNLEQAREQLKQALKAANLPKAATFRFDQRGLVVTIATDQVLFSSGDATLLAEGKKILSALAPTLLKVPNMLSVDGHTNSIPISSGRFPSNWELSTDRATGVLRYLASAHHIPVTRMSATGFADTKPLASNNTPLGLVMNRRVEIVVIANVDTSLGKAVAEQAAQDDQGAAAGPPAKQQDADKVAQLQAAAEKAAAAQLAAEKQAEAARQAAAQARKAAEEAAGSTAGSTAGGG